MPIPSGGISTVDLDATTDSPATARASALLPAVQQFNQLIASANGVSGMAVLDASGFLAGYGRLSAAQTWTGAQTFTASTLTLGGVTTQLRFRDTSVALPGGLYFIQSGAGTLRVIRNTAAAGDFSTGTYPLIINANDSVTFVGAVSVSNGVAPGEAINRAQLDAKVYGGRVTNNGTASIAYAPSGWSVVRNSTGQTDVTHNLGTLSYSVVVCVGENAGTGLAQSPSIGTNSFRVQTFIGGSATADLAYNFVLVRN